MKKLRLAVAVLLTVAALGSVVPKADAASCPIYQVCMIIYPQGTCTCPGFYCNGRFICGIPIQ